MGKRASPPIRIRRAVSGDGERCAEIFLHARQAAFPGRSAFEAEDYALAVAEDEVWVAEIGGLVVGFVSLDLAADDLRLIFVHPDWQHRGIGSRLLTAACQRLDRPARLSCHADNRVARAFYERNGWIPEAGAESFVFYRK
ncbi:GNAT family N-acetyltransferase [Arenibaculum pallidiluteum]|uniref:GNAT family N-acetyltransferase n=1 Tax=Arenibaculum pallidiluteum TaxID=2812559 RepID=UPI001A963C19|nr:GNAT family N-acetyltransferase [Arenibaculum pallidiluteum]